MAKADSSLRYTLNDARTLCNQQTTAASLVYKQLKLLNLKRDVSLLRLNCSNFDLTSVQLVNLVCVCVFQITLDNITVLHGNLSFICLLPVVVMNVMNVYWTIDLPNGLSSCGVTSIYI